MDERWRQAKTLGERLTWARLKEGISKKADFARSVKIEPGTYRTYERDEREPENEDIQRMAKKLKVYWPWLATGNGRPDGVILHDELQAALLQKLEAMEQKKRDDALKAMLALAEHYSKADGSQ